MSDEEFMDWLAMLGFETTPLQRSCIQAIGAGRPAFTVRRSDLRPGVEELMRQVERLKKRVLMCYPASSPEAPGAGD